jgi:hypothetical protein
MTLRLPGLNVTHSTTLPASRKGLLNHAFLTSYSVSLLLGCERGFRIRIVRRSDTGVSFCDLLVETPCQISFTLALECHDTAIFRIMVAGALAND